MNTNLVLRRETPADFRIVETLTREAFWNLHGPGCDEHFLSHILRNADAFIPELDYVAELDGVTVANIMYAKACIRLDHGGELPVIGFGPVSVLPEYQRQGIGSTLIHHTLALAKEFNYNAVLIYGDPAYYSRVGFVPAERFHIATDHNEYHAALQAFELQPGALGNAAGCFFESDAYHIDTDAASAFDQTFPPKGKQAGTPSQQRFAQIAAMRKPRGAA
ncbi:MAG TPA: N-acetyltransferase [Candidatus Limiplasma sp.]|nr:N-acetyltransferase [Candidatus Limiplasma sp.]